MDTASERCSGSKLGPDRLTVSAGLVDEALAALELAAAPHGELYERWADDGAWKASIAELREQWVAARPNA